MNRYRFCSHRSAVACAITVFLFSLLPLNAVGKSQQAAHPRALPQGAAFWAWTQDKWTGNDAPFARTRSQIEAAVASGTSPRTLVAKYRKVALQKPNSALAQFAWGYAAYKAAVDPKVGANEGQRYLNDAFTGLALAPPPHSYNYTRLRFLSGAQVGPFPELKSVGQRLLQHTPGDYDVRYYVATILANSRSPLDRSKGQAYAEDLARQRPKDPAALGLLGGVYYQSWVQTRSKADGERAVAAYRRYLQVAPADYAFRQVAEYLINKVEKG